MKFSTFAVLWFVLSSLLVAFGQGSDARRNRWVNGYWSILDRVDQFGRSEFVRIPEVQAELKLTPEQNHELQRRELERRKAHDDATIVMQLAEVDPAEGQRVLAEHEAAGRRTSIEDLKAVLTATQIRRLQEITVQLKGPFAVDETDIQARLNLSPEQQQQIRMISEDFFARQLSLRRLRGERTNVHIKTYKDSHFKDENGEYRNDPKVVKELDQFQGRLEALRADADRAILRTLSRRQRETFAKLAGAPFELVKDMKQPGSLPELTMPKEKRLRKDDPKPKAEGKAEAPPAAEAKKS